MEELSLFIVEDRAILAEALIFQLEKLGYRVDGQANSGEEAMEKLELLRPDLMILDIDLGENMSGIDVARQLRAQNGPPFIFLTGISDEGTIAEAVATEPVAFLEKPVTSRRLSAAIDIAVENLDNDHPARLGQVAPQVPVPVSAREDFIFIRVRNRYARISLAEIQYIQADESYSRVHTQDQVHVLSIKLIDIERRLKSPDLIRVHRSYIVNRHHVTGIEDNVLILPSGNVPVGKTYRDKIRSLFNII